MADKHLKEYKRCSDVEVVAVFARTEGAAEAFAEKHGLESIRCYRDHQAMLHENQLDIVSVCTPNCAHASYSIDALRAGVNVLCEKPMSVTLEEAVEMCRAEKESGKLLCIGFQPRMSKNMQKIKTIVQSGALGKVYYLQSGGGRRHGIPASLGSSYIKVEKAGSGALGDIGCYSLDMLLNAVGYPKPITATGTKYDFFGKDLSYYGANLTFAEEFSVDDFAAGFIRLEGGITLDFRIAWAMHMDTTGDALILGTKGGLRIPSTECWNGSYREPMTLYYNENGEPKERKIAYEKEDISELFYLKIRSFVDAVKEGLPSPIPSREILYNQAIIEGLLTSADLGREVLLEIPEI